MEVEEYVMQARGSGRRYRIRVAKPVQAPPQAGYPVIYVLDANAVFGTAMETVRVQSRRTEKTGVPPTMIVGIGYESDEPFPPDRHYDFTLETASKELPAHPLGAEWPPQGGAQAFLRFIEEQLKPEIVQGYPIDSNRQTIFGHSLGGLFVLYALFALPSSFRTYVAGSPSIHWNKRALLSEELAFSSRCDTDRERGILIAVGELEDHHVSGMVVHAREMSERLSSLTNLNLTVNFRIFEDDNHVSLLPALISRAVRFASRRDR